MTCFLKKITSTLKSRLFFVVNNKIDYLCFLYFNCVVRGLGNSMKTSNPRLFKVHISGNYNYIFDSSLQAANVNIQLNGNNNTVIFDNCRLINGLKIIINGNNCSVVIGHGVGIGGARFVCEGEYNLIQVGNDCLLSDNIELWASDGHKIYDINKIRRTNEPAKITLDEKVWLGTGVKVLKGVHIGKGSIVGMGSVVTKNVSANSIFVGNPARLIQNDICWEI